MNLSLGQRPTGSNKSKANSQSGIRFGFGLRDSDSGIECGQKQSKVEPSQAKPGALIKSLRGQPVGQRQPLLPDTARKIATDCGPPTTDRDHQEPFQIDPIRKQFFGDSGHH